jgi:hypothetical protein
MESERGDNITNILDNYKDAEKKVFLFEYQNVIEI